MQAVNAAASREQRNATPARLSENAKRALLEFASAAGCVSIVGGGGGCLPLSTRTVPREPRQLLRSLDSRTRRRSSAHASK